VASAFYYYPANGRAAVKIDLNRTVTTRRGPNTMHRQSVSEAWTGTLATVQWGGRRSITVRYEWGGTGASDRTIRRALVGLINHLKRGGTCLFVEDDTKFCAAFVAPDPSFMSVGDTVVSIETPFTDNLLTAGHAQLGAREVYLRSSAPDVQEEMFLVSQVVGLIVEFTTPIRMDHSSQAWVMLHDAGTWAAMRLPPDARGDDLIPHNHEISFTLDLPLEEDEATLEALAATGATLLGTSGGEGDGLDEIIDEVLDEHQPDPPFGGPEDPV
jgi:hypothetical protein